MPIFPKDMTDNGFRLAKINVSDGVSNHQVGKVYGFDGIANRLIYSAETQFYPGTTPSTIKTCNGGEVWSDFSDFSMNIYTSQPNYNSHIRAILIDLTDISTLKISGKWGSGGPNTAAGIWLTSKAVWDANPYIYPYYIFVSPNTAYYSHASAKSNGTITEATFDVSELTGLHYLCVGCYASNTLIAAYAGISSVIGD